MCFEWLYTAERYKEKKNSKGFFEGIADSFKRKGKSMGVSLGLLNPELSAFQKKKLLHEFHTFFDINKDGTLEWKDFDLARQRICEMSGWKQGTDRYRSVHELFKDIWRKLQDDGDENFDGKISQDEWLKMWTSFNKQFLLDQGKTREDADGEPPLPEWLDKYVEYKFNLLDRTEKPPLPEWLDKHAKYKFNLLDRTGNGYVDAEEYEYVMNEFGVSPKDAKSAFLMFSQNNEKKVDLVYFKKLCGEYYRSDEPGALGNFINGRLTFND